jgi:hypothetical protein
MDQLLRPDCLDCDPSSPQAVDVWRCWLKKFQNFLELIDSKNPNKLNTLIHFLSPSLYKSIADCDTYDAALQVLTELFDRPVNEVFARHSLATRTQLSGETIDQYLIALQSLAKSCNFKAVTAIVHRDEAIRDAFIAGLSSPSIRTRLLENPILDLQNAISQARSLEAAQLNAQTYIQLHSLNALSKSSDTNSSPQIKSLEPSSCSAVSKRCDYCGGQYHRRPQCPAREAICRFCEKKGHYAKVCRSSKKISANSILSATTSRMSGLLEVQEPSLPTGRQGASCSVTASNSTTHLLKPAVVTVSIKDNNYQALVDSGSTDNFISDSLVQQLQIMVRPSSGSVVMASTSLTSSIQSE